MNKRHRPHFFIRSFVIALLIGFVASPCLAIPDPAGKITRIQGKVDIIREGKTISAELMGDVFATDGIKTDPAGNAELILSDGTSIQIGPDSQLSLTQYQFSLSEKNPSFIAKLLNGVFVYISGAISKVHPDAVKLETPDAVIGIRGTKLVVKVEQIISIPGRKAGRKGKTTVILFRDPSGNVGRVTITNDQGTQLLDRESFAVTVSFGEMPIQQLFMGEKVLKEMLPMSLHPFIFENYTPGLPYTEVAPSLNDLNDAFIRPASPRNRSPHQRRRLKNRFQTKLTKDAYRFRSFLISSYACWISLNLSLANLINSSGSPLASILSG